MRMNNFSYTYMRYIAVKLVRPRHIGTDSRNTVCTENSRREHPQRVTLTTAIAFLAI